MEIDLERVRSMKADLEQRGVEFCWATYVDIHGVPKGKTVPIASFEKMAKGSELFTVGAMEGLGLVGPHEDECAAVPDLDTCVVLPWDPRIAWFSSDLHYHGEPYVNDPRTILKRNVARAHELGFRMKVGIEAEFYVFRNGAAGERERLAGQPYKGVCPAYDIHQTAQSLDFLAPMVRFMNELGWGVYSFDQEGGHSQYELDFAYDDVLPDGGPAVARIVTFVFVVVPVFEKVQLTKSFLARDGPDVIVLFDFFEQSMPFGVQFVLLRYPAPESLDFFRVGHGREVALALGHEVENLLPEWLTRVLSPGRRPVYESITGNAV